jgi:hypothetical protein
MPIPAAALALLAATVLGGGSVMAGENKKKKEEQAKAMKVFDESVKVNQHILQNPDKFPAESIEAAAKALSGIDPKIMQTYEPVIAERRKTQQTNDALSTVMMNSLKTGAISTATTTVPPTTAPSKTKAFDMPRQIQDIPYIDTYKEMAQKYNVPITTGIALHNAESEFNPNAKSKTGVVGIGQVTKSTMQEMGFDPNQRHIPKVSIEASFKYLRTLTDRGQIKDLNDMNQVVDYYTTPAGGGSKNYKTKVSIYKQYYDNMFASAPKVDEVAPETGKLPIGQQYIYDAALRSIKMHRGADGKISYDMQPFAQNSVDDMLADQLRGMPPEERTAVLQFGLMGKMGLGPKYEIHKNETTGRLEGHFFDPATNKVTVVPGPKIGETIAEKRQAEVTQAGQKEAAQAVGKETGAAMVAETRQAREAQEETQKRQKGLEKIPTETQGEMSKATGRMMGMGKLTARIEAAGTDAMGAFDMNNLPIGPLSRITQLPQYANISQDEVGVQRELFVDAAAQAISSLYETGGKQLSDKEIQNLKAYVLDPNLPPHIWIARFNNWWEDGLNLTEAKIATWKKVGYDVRDLEANLNEVRKQIQPLEWLPPSLRTYEERAKGIQKKRQSMDDSYNKLMGGKK